MENINISLLNSLEKILEIFPPDSRDKFWWPDGLEAVIKEADEITTRALLNQL